MVRVITQETYDEAVRENMVEFEMSPEEAILEAIAQFEAQDVDLTNIITDVALQPDNKPLLSNAIIRLKKLGVPKSEAEEESLIGELNILRNEFRKGLAYRVRAGNEGAYDALIQVVESTHKRFIDSKHTTDGQFLSLLMDTLTRLMDTYPDLLNDRGVKFIISALNVYKEKVPLCSVLKWTRICCTMHEANKEKLYAKGIGEILNKIIRRSKEKEVLISCLRLIRKLCADDDIRVECSKTHERSKGLGYILLPTLTDYFKGLVLVGTAEYATPQIIGELMLTMSSLMVCEDLCLNMRGVVDILLKALAENYDKELMVKNGAALITAATGSDEVKSEFVKGGIIPVMVSLLSKHVENAAVSSALLLATGALTRREAAHSKQFLDDGAAEAIVECMSRHEGDADVTKNACRAIRDMVARYREQNNKFHELDVEALLKRSLGKFDKNIDYEIRSALRDLDCDVKLEEQWTGKGVQLKQ